MFIKKIRSKQPEGSKSSSRYFSTPLLGFSTTNNETQASQKSWSPQPNRVLSVPAFARQTEERKLQRPAVKIDTDLSAAVSSFTPGGTVDMEDIPDLPKVTRRGRRIVSMPVPPREHVVLEKHKSLPAPAPSRMEPMAPPVPEKTASVQPILETPEEVPVITSPPLSITSHRVTSAPAPPTQEYFHSVKHSWSSVGTPSLSSVDDDTSSIYLNHSDRLYVYTKDMESEASSMKSPLNSCFSNASNSSVFELYCSTSDRGSFGQRSEVPPPVPKKSASKKPNYNFCLDAGAEYEKSRFMIPEAYQVKPKHRLHA